MGDKDTILQRATSGVGAAMFGSWVLFLGPVGFVLLLGVAYAMAVQNLALGIICGLLLASPVFLIAAWVAVGSFGLLRTRWIASKAPSAESAVETVGPD